MLSLKNLLNVHTAEEPMLRIPMYHQPDETTCGPTCLQSVYEYYRDPIPLQTVIEEVQQLEEGGTLGSLLALHALQRGYRAVIISYNLQVFDPTWYSKDRETIMQNLQKQSDFKKNEKLTLASEAYIRFLEAGGELGLEDLRPAVIRRYLKKEQPVIAGLSATYLYRSPREYGPDLVYDDIRGEPSGHFVLLHGYEKKTREILIADPFLKNPVSESQFYKMNIDRVINAILLGIVTYDANLIVITPG